MKFLTPDSVRQHYYVATLSANKQVGFAIRNLSDLNNIKILFLLLKTF